MHVNLEILDFRLNENDIKFEKACLVNKFVINIIAHKLVNIYILAKVFFLFLYFE